MYVRLGGVGSGTKANPFGSIDEAITLATEGGHSQVLICAGTYAETLTVGEGSTPIEIVGGLDCDTWESDEAAVTKVVAPAGKHALEIVSREVELRGLRLEVPDAEDAGASVIGGYVIDSQVTLENVRITVGNGMAGANGVLVPYVLPTAAHLTGKSSTIGLAGGETQYTCPDGRTTTGGAGGGTWATGTPTGGNGLPGHVDNPAAGRGGLGTPESACLTTSKGANGAPGITGPHGPTVSMVGSIVLDRWRGRNGNAGLSGRPGQGGGGGGGTSVAYSAGGGAGGCGGAGGPGGQAGGSSIGLIAIRSELVVESSVIQTSDGGAGGSGMAGQPGSPGGLAGVPYSNGSTIIGCAGGIGGPGGLGGSGSGGAGGISVAVVSTADSSVVFVETDTEQGLPGARGKGGLTPSLDGIPGIAQPTYQL